MNQPWFADPNAFGAWYGAIAGGVGGSLGGLLGSLVGYCAPRGKSKRLVLAALGFFTALGLLQLGFGLVALAAGQPFGIWYPPTLCGAIYTVVMGGLFPMVRRRYEEAEGRRVDAEGIRHS